jgi:hypothetical protein
VRGKDVERAPSGVGGLGGQPEIKIKRVQRAEVRRGDRERGCRVCGVGGCIHDAAVPTDRDYSRG